MNQPLMFPTQNIPSPWRLFLAAIALSTASNGLHAAAPSEPVPWRLSVFQADVTPPVGHPLLAISGSHSVAKVIKDPLFAKGLVLQGPDQPIVLVGVDWCELRNDAYTRWRELLAAAAGTTPERVLVSCLHQHDAPYFDLTAQKLMADSPGGGDICDIAFHERAVQRVASALKGSLAGARSITHIGTSRAQVQQVASSRRIVLPGGKVTYGRFSRTASALLRALPDGEIDPWLACLTFWQDEVPLAVVSSYACHPMSHYGAGDVSADFIGMARAKREEDDPSVFQVYLTGCSGDVTAGKYNDGAKATRVILADRLYNAMKEAFNSSAKQKLKAVSCRAVPLVLPHGETAALQPEFLRQQLADPKVPFAKRVHAALGLSSLQRHPAGHHIDLQVIDFGPAQIVLLPAESFVSYQLFAQQLRPESLVMGAGFGESAPGYIPTAQAFAEGFREEHGYCWVAPGAENLILEGLKKALPPQ